jgi:hypothetical protein
LLCVFRTNRVAVMDEPEPPVSAGFM